MSKKKNWPNKSDLDRIMPELEKAQGSLHLNDNASPLEKFRFQLCQKLLRYKVEGKISQRELASELGINESIVSKIFHHRIENISTDRLIEYVQVIEPNIDLRVAN